LIYKGLEDKISPKKETKEWQKRNLKVLEKDRGNKRFRIL